MNHVRTPQKINNLSWFSEAWDLYQANRKICVATGVICLLALFSTAMHSFSGMHGVKAPLHHSDRTGLLLLLQNFIIGVLPYLVGVLCVQKIEWSTNPKRGLIAYVSLIFYSFIEYALYFLIDKIPVAHHKITLGFFIYPFIAPLFILGYAYVASGVSIVEALQRSFKSALPIYWKLTWLYFVYSTLLLLITCTCFGIVVAAPLMGIIVALAARDYGGLKVFTGDVISNTEIPEALREENPLPPKE
jgi:hypothetical protein